MMRVYVDGQSLQDRITAERGIGRYVAEYAGAVERLRPGFVDKWLIRSDGPVPAQVADLIWRGRVAMSDDTDLERPDIWHVPSPFEALDAPIDAVWPEWARHPRTSLYVTLYDLIPLVFSDQYLADRRWRARYNVRAQMVARADRVLAISEATARDATRILGISPSRIDVVGTGTSSWLLDDRAPSTPAGGRPEVPGLNREYVMYTGGIDFRKNIEGLLRGWSLVAPEVRRTHQLVLVCRMSQVERDVLDGYARELGVERDVLYTGYVDDDLLRDLYAHAKLFIFPSLYEGFGLPVVEAAACGAPVIVGDNSSLIDLVPDPRGRFDASDPADIAACLMQVLEDDVLRAALRQPRLAEQHRWEDVARRTVESYEKAGRRRLARRPRVWLVSPMPPTPSGVADYSMALLRELAKLADVDVMTTPDAQRDPIPGVRWFTYDDAGAVERLYGRPDLRIMAMGNSEFHVPIMRLLRRYGGVAIAHDVRFTGLLAAARALAPELLDEDVAQMLDDIASERRPSQHRDHMWLDSHRYYLVNGLLTGSALRGSEIILTHSPSSQSLARLNLAPEMRPKVGVINFGHRVLPVPAGTVRDAVVSLGIQHWTKDSVKVCEAFVDLAPQYPELTFALVGRFFDDEAYARCREMIDDAGLADRVLLTGWVTPDEYARWLERGRLAVQLRAYTNGESSAAVADCLGAGVPLVTTALGSSVDLADVVHLVPPDVRADDLAACLKNLLEDADRSAELARAGLQHAQESSFERVAQELMALCPVIRA
ncbi:glycosyltransferase [Cellulomonas wangsupingiae]|uniref:Glycosyltransferase n=1 Tax=Cellulomonas wangsupingiae TaxID=2968085 RepID=A0ABY5K4U6_9CELL|nr:glycosyltransferase [Cellulomonas wangsupingiae]MCC2335701.1 glycosyltransferase [Cellulomonas wangsupingiae]MCM0640332.1 glycosyltransferase [Cellulomonas wangsupingiae]UUI63936.1 glycosyltransferase [Cellulomonas wangsupingiae]